MANWVTVSLFFMILGVLSLIAIFAAAAYVLRGLRGGGSRQVRQEETRMIQEMYQHLSTLAERVSALETILLDRQKGRDHGDAKR